MPIPTPPDSWGRPWLRTVTSVRRPSRSMVKRNSLPAGLERITSPTVPTWVTGWPSMATITSPGWSTSAAGDPRTTSTTRAPLLVTVTGMPTERAAATAASSWLSLKISGCERFVSAGIHAFGEDVAEGEHLRSGRTAATSRRRALGWLSRTLVAR